MGTCYVVFKGKKPRIYMAWHECSEQVLSVKIAIYKKYNNYDIALSDFNSYFGASTPSTKALGKMLSLCLYSCWCLVFGSGCPCLATVTAVHRLMMTQRED
jgi:hypothetical protein